MHYSRMLPLLIIPVLAILLSMVRAADFDAWVAPNESIEAGSPNVLFNLTINNTNQSVNITGVNITLPDGFVFVSGSNQTSAGQVLFINDSVNLTWTNQTQEGFIANLSGAWFVFNASVNITPGDYYFNITVLDTLNVTNSTNITIGLIECNISLNPTIISPVGDSVVWGESLEVSGYIEDACSNPVENVTVNWTFSSIPNNWTREQNQSNQSQGFYNYTWNETERPPGWYNLSMNISKSGYSDNETIQEDAFHIGMEPDILLVDVDRTGTCPDTFHFWTQLTDAGNDYNNITLEVRLWNESSGNWEDWQVANWTWQDQLSADYVDFYHNFTNGSWYPGLYSYRFQSVDEYNLSDMQEGSDNFTIYNCSKVINIILVPPTPKNGSYSDSPNITINITFTSPYYNLTDCILSYNNGTITNFTANASQGWCEFNITNQSEGLFNYSVRVGNTYTNDSWNGTWYVGFDFTCIENWIYGDWGSCTGGYQYRSYTDSNECGTYNNRSATSQECDDGGGGGGGGGETYPTATKVWSSIKPGIPAVMEINREGISATSVAIEVSETVGTCNVVVKGFSSRPSGVSETPPGRVQGYLNITTTANRSRLSRVTIGFSVGRSWIERNGIDSSTIELMRLEGNWTGLSTSLMGSDNTTLKFTAVSPGLSWFAVTGREAEENVTGEEPEPPEGEVPEPPPEGEPESSEDLPEAAGDVCETGESQCVAGLILQACNRWGTGWLNEATCLYGCRDGECVTQLVIEVDYNQLWVAVAAIAILVALSIIYVKRKAIDDFLFWRF